MTQPYSLAETIYALSSGAGKGGVAVIRVSGTKAKEIMASLTGLTEIKPRYAYFKALKNRQGETIDHALILYFNAPNSFTGEDVVEFQVHGGATVIKAVFEAIGSFENTRPAERGEFSRRAVVYGKMDLTSAEGLMDLIDATSEQQRKQALVQMEGRLGNMYESWRQSLVHDMAYLEAFIDFPEEDIPPEKMALIDAGIANLCQKIEAHLADERKGERLREGFLIALVGSPNVGKSSLINALSKEEVAIVSDEAGTTRDVVQAHLDIAGFPVILADTAGLRESCQSIEAQGIERAVRKAKTADLILNIQDCATFPNMTPLPDDLKNIPVKTIWNKADLLDKETYQYHKDMFVSATTKEGLGKLSAYLSDFLKENFTPSNTGIITRERYRVALKECLFSLKNALKAEFLELKAEDLRLAGRALGRIVGRIDTDELLDVIFKDFCIGK